MPKRQRKGVKTPVARRATPEERLTHCPPPETLKTLSSASAVLTARHADLASWSLMSWELGGVNRGTLSEVASGSRAPSRLLIKKMNSAYGCHLHPARVKIVVEVCPLCGETPTPRHRCKNAAKRPRRTYDISYKRLRELLQNPYLKDS